MEGDGGRGKTHACERKVTMSRKEKIIAIFFELNQKAKLRN